MTGEPLTERGRQAVAGTRVDDELDAARAAGGRGERMRPRPWLPRLEPGDHPHHFGGPGDETTRSLDNLRVANRYFGGTRSLLRPLCSLLRSGPAGVVRVLDVGCGGADSPLALADWARRHARRVQITVVDRDATVVARAATACGPWPEIRVVRGEAARLPFADGAFDYVTSSMLLHYFSLAEAADLLHRWRRLATRAVVVADVQRHWIPCAAIGLLGQLSGSPLFRHGHADTVRRGFTAAELGGLGRRAGFVRMRVRRHVPFRLSLVGWL
jgi:SAM-dependent methyltransferase